MKLRVAALGILLYGGTFVSSASPPRDTSADGFKQQPGIFLDAPIDSDPKTPSATVSSVRYGPFALPAGGMADRILIDVEKPCVDCYIVAVQSRQEDLNRTEYYTASGLWLHHVILFNEAQRDLTCPRMAGERFYGGGNTRATRRWNLHGRWGYYVGKDDEWDMVVDLMNEGTVDFDVMLRIDFEWVSASSAEGRQYRRVRPIWLALKDFCSDSGVPVRSLTEPFHIKTPEWISTVDGPLVDGSAHVHDGGLDMVTYRNGEEICRSVQLYGQTTEPHIIGQGACKMAGRIKKGDVLTAEVQYDATQHAVVMHNGKPDPVMGSDGLYVGIE